MLTPAELAAHCRVSERTVARMVGEGCPSMLIGKRRRFDLAAVTEWMRERGAAACPSDKTTPAATTQKFASAGAAYTADFRKAHLRVMPSGSKQS